MKQTAKFIKQPEGTWTGDARLFKIDPPMAYEGSYRGEGSGETEYVVVSATNAMFSGPETYIFPATQDGVCINYGELEGSYRGGLDHARALRGAGYSVADTA